MESLYTTIRLVGIIKFLDGTQAAIQHLSLSAIRYPGLLDLPGGPIPGVDTANSVTH